MVAVRMLTWNLWWMFDRSAGRQKRISQAIGDAAAQVLLLQEIWPEQVQSLATEHGYDVVSISTGPFRNRLDVKVPDGATFGNAVLSRLPATEVPPLLLPSEPDTAHRVAVGAVVDTPSGVLGVVSTHLTHIWDRSDVRIQQLDAIAGWIAEHIPTDVPVVVGGDLNLVPTSPEYDHLVAAGWTDLWATDPTRGLAATMDPENPNLRDTAWMRERNGPDTPADAGVQLDYVLSAPGRPPVSAPQMETIGRANDHPWPSDHLGWLADLAF